MLSSSSPEASSNQSNSLKSASVSDPMSSCRKKKSEGGSFIADVRDHIDEFVHASMEEHKTCFKKTVLKMFGMSSAVMERNSAEDESHLPLQTSVAE